MTAVSTTIDGTVAVIRVDDGKANAIGHGLIAELHGALDRAEAEARAVCIVGREGRLSAGFDLSVLADGSDATIALMKAGGRLILRLYGHPQPTVVAVTGHALAAGALLVLACDTRLAADVPAKIGLNETAIGLPLPAFATALATDRLDPRRLAAATLQATIFDPRGALDAGFIDQVLPAAEVVDASIAEARRLSAIRTGAYARTKERMRAAMIERELANLDADLADMSPPTP